MRQVLINLKSWLLQDKRRVLIIIFILIAAGYYLYSRSSATETMTPQTATVEKGTIISSVTASGTIVSSNIENVTTQASGTVKKVYISDGDYVYKGQKLAEIELDVQGQQNYLSAYSSYLGSVSSVNSAKNALEVADAGLAVTYDEIKGHDDDEDLATKETRVRAETSQRNAIDNVKVAEARLSSAAISLRTTTPVITSPTSGTVKSVTIAQGMNIGAAETASGSRANQRVATIGTEGLPIATFNVSEIDVVNIKPDQKATIMLDSITDKTFTGKVVSVDRVGSVTSNVTTYPVIIQLDTSSDEILPNMAATANIIVETKANILTVPSSAVNYSGSDTTVTKMENDEQVKTTVEVGISSDTETEIISGLYEGDEILTNTQSVSTSSQSQSGENRGFIPGGGEMRMITR
ncbi:efflux RND transporter periplasmic adaptor subunit [Candidatus Woesebacteria bacterium]|nr:efflux RND transporter periplasmic adaptor subunit [Candidatus Woesebacteria bacterium]